MKVYPCQFKYVNTYGGDVVLVIFAHMAPRLALFIFLPCRQTNGAPRMSMFKSTKTTSRDSLLQVIILLFTPLEGLLVFLCQSSLPFENRNQGKNISKSLPWRRRKSKQFSLKAFKHQP